MTRTEDFRRKAAKKHIHKRENIIKNVYRDKNWYEAVKLQSHRLSKGKVHCSCPMCSRKTKKKKKKRLKHGNYYPSKDWKHSDAQKIESAEQELQEYESS